MLIRAEGTFVDKLAPMPSTTEMIVIAVVVLVNIPLAAPLVWVGWNRMTGPFPPRPRGANGVRREFQSIAIDIFSYGYCVHLTADEECLHVEPVLLLRSLGVKETASILWNAMTIKAAGRWSLKVRADKIDLQLPVWCRPLIATSGA